MSEMNDLELLNKVASIFSQQTIADEINHPREVVNRWLKERNKQPDQDWLTYAERIALESMLPKPCSEDREFTFIDLFAGIGGIRYGFEKAGGKCVFTSEYDKYAVKTYLANYHCDHDVHGDIKEITQPEGMDKNQAYEFIQERIPDHDVLLAGFPCQPFSIAGVSKKNSLGRAHGFECDTQGTLFFDVARIIDAKRPLAIMLENVKNLKSHDRGKTFKVIMNTLDELGYDVIDREYNQLQSDPKIINGKNFVPQNRERIVIVAFRRDLDVTDGLTLKDVKKYFPKKEPVVGDILENEATVDEKYVLTPKLWNYLKGYAEKHKKAGNGFGFGKVTASDRSTRTLSARYYKDGSEVLVDRGPRKRPRRLTPRECARLMGFDKKGESNFVIPVSDTQAYKQFGNSVVVPVFESVALLMKPYIAKAQEKSKKAKRKKAA
ncbi:MULTISPECIES: DNA (cytosine-5-)-methyltransferase [Spongiibacteraceae]|uniref:Cytosine-specific methyltransferase n=1 Tax=Zhongshania aliphaticivorans TaxID=1470434 RepID=A0A127M270_9GAMM|nr:MULTISPECIES: DNA (cytosine-5-)-methyltransferase [Spongiibacteraceae]AMO67333.1 DNA cytosine methyltransferase [Zhongshania aliphaticivorans]MBM7422308.1 DNA (cytosine-5)-methyltransferase 1 [Spongiibacter marinus]